MSINKDTDVIINDTDSNSNLDLKERTGLPKDDTDGHGGNFDEVDHVCDTSDPSKCKSPDHINMNDYTTKKTVATGLFDIAIFSANASRLWRTLQEKPGPFFYPEVSILITILVLQVATGILLMLIGKADIRKKSDRKMIDGWNNMATLAIFVITVLNILVSTFSTVAPK
ncbi:unnamed protein product [Owenia fusiformis]|uniref:Uncharacterized protein n=1 Tax=Owenia fusiformis TaxID=6347 RepID=A0A8J1T8V0_OWEFU|nr:unnamed protein product [Owenia fusiformis]